MSTNCNRNGHAFARATLQDSINAEASRRCERDKRVRRGENGRKPRDSQSTCAYSIRDVAFCILEGVSDRHGKRRACVSEDKSAAQ